MSHAAVDQSLIKTLSLSEDLVRTGLSQTPIEHQLSFILPRIGDQLGRLPGRLARKPSIEMIIQSKQLDSITPSALS